MNLEGLMAFIFGALADLNPDAAAVIWAWFNSPELMLAAIGAAVEALGECGLQLALVKA